MSTGSMLFFLLFFFVFYIIVPSSVLEMYFTLSKTSVCFNSVIYCNFYITQNCREYSPGLCMFLVRCSYTSGRFRTNNAPRCSGTPGLLLLFPRCDRHRCLPANDSEDTQKYLVSETDESMPLVTSRGQKFTMDI